MKIVITGGFGFIGSSLAKALINEDHEIIILDNIKEVDSPRTILGISSSIFCDITSLDSLMEHRIKDCDLLLHCAGQPSAAMSFKFPKVDMDINIVGTFNILNWCKDNDIPRIIYASTFNVYKEDFDKESYNEDMYCMPKSLYALSKHTAENYIQIYSEHFGLKWNIMRMFNVYGPGQDPNNTFLGMVSIFMNMVRTTNYVGVKGSLERFRDFVYIDDVIQAWLLCINNNHAVNHIFNVGSGDKVTVRQLLEGIVDAYDKKGVVKIEELESTPGDFMGSIADITASKVKLGYEPKVKIENGLLKFKEWLDKYS